MDGTAAGVADHGVGGHSAGSPAQGACSAFSPGWPWSMIIIDHGDDDNGHDDDDKGDGDGDDDDI